MYARQRIGSDVEDVRANDAMKNEDREEEEKKKTVIRDTRETCAAQNEDGKRQKKLSPRKERTFG